VTDWSKLLILTLQLLFQIIDPFLQSFSIPMLIRRPNINCRRPGRTVGHPIAITTRGNITHLQSRSQGKIVQLGLDKHIDAALHELVEVLPHGFFNALIEFFELERAGRDGWREAFEVRSRGSEGEFPGACEA